MGKMVKTVHLVQSQALGGVAEGPVDLDQQFLMESLVGLDLVGLVIQPPEQVEAVKQGRGMPEEMVFFLLLLLGTLAAAGPVALEVNLVQMTWAVLAEQAFLAQ
jgi:hypothetical protein